MIPIECPKCGRGGSVPPDRLNARLVCKACHTVFHLDNTGRMVLGDPESLDMKSTKSRKQESKIEDFDLAQTWKDIPAPVKYGVPAAILAAVLYLNVGFGGGSTDYASRAQSLVGAVMANNKSKVVSMSMSESADAAGKWFDVLRGEVEKSKFSSGAAVSQPALISGDPDKEANISMMVIVTENGTNLTITLPLKRDGGSWMFDATQGLGIAEKTAAANAASK
jgi:hypothetical protein